MSNAPRVATSAPGLGRGESSQAILHIVAFGPVAEDSAARPIGTGSTGPLSAGRGLAIERPVVNRLVPDDGEVPAKSGLTQHRRCIAANQHRLPGQKRMVIVQREAERGIG